MDVRKTAQAAREAAGVLAGATADQKNAAMRHMAQRLEARRGDILSANEADLDRAREEGIDQHLVDRLRFGESKIASRVGSLGKIEALPDPVGEVFRNETRPGGLNVSRVRVPLGVILMIYEARPHVTVNAGAFCLKSGNAAILRGGSEARECNALLGELWQDSLDDAGLPLDAVQVISGSHEQIDELLQLDELIDLVIPRGGKGLIRSVSEKSRIPVVKHFAGVCHVYLDGSGDVARGIQIALDSKCLMPEVCNAMETLLVDAALADRLGEIVGAFAANGVEVRGCERTRSAVEGVKPADEEDWTTEYLDEIVSIRVVDGVDAAIDHINRYGSHHTDVIVADDDRRAARFAQQVDSGVVLVNASTMFCDGESLGMGAEIGISTDKIHARGPMGLEELTSYKFVIRGNGNLMGPERETQAQ